jgi:glycosyltransferase involved in cell wall biosynthesis
MKISVITVNLNNRFGLEQTIKSVIAQNLDTLEHIVIDGKSTDGSLDVLKAYSNVKTFWLSEKDTGIYNAMNKGINIATGDYVLFLNSGDTFSGDTIIKQAITLINNEDLIYGNIIYNDLNKSWVKTFPASSCYLH